MKKNAQTILILAISFVFIALSLFLAASFFARRSGSAANTDTDTKNAPTAENGQEAMHTNPQEPITDYLCASKLELDLSSKDFTPASPDDIVKNTCYDLSVPTYITKIDTTYFIVDCYHNQVIYNDNLTEPLEEWQVMTNEINLGHTIASDGLVYLIDDTENNRILIFEKKDGIFYHTQTFDNIGDRPHYIIYNDIDATFYVWSSMNGEMYLMRRTPGGTRVYLTEIRKIDALSETYVRSFTIIGDEIYFVSGIPSKTPSIICVWRDSFKIKDTYPVPDSMAGMIQLTKIDGCYYITISTDISGSQDYATIIRTKDLSKLSEGGYEDIYENFIGGGTPYYITQFDNACYITEHRLPGHSIWRFQIKDDKITNVETIY